ncbi:hypothetical protein ACFLQ6_05480 [Thermoproteota archaeon]
MFKTDVFKAALTTYLLWFMDNLEPIGWYFPFGYIKIIGNLDIFGIIQFTICVVLMTFGWCTKRWWLVAGSFFGFMIGVTILIIKFFFNLT